MIKLMALMLALLSFAPAFAQDAVALLSLADEKVYTPRAKGLKDLQVDFVSPQITKQLNDQMIFGTVKEVTFRLYWTAEPERVAMEILGLPEGFNEVKEELKASMLGRLETIIPIPVAKRLAAYQLKLSPTDRRNIIATDTSNQLPIPEFVLTIGARNTLDKSIGKKPVGLMTTTYTYGTETWSDPRYPLTGMVTTSEEGPVTLVSTTEISYSVISGMGLPSVLKTSSKQTIRPPGSKDKPIERSSSDTLFFKNYKVNSGAATKWFLGQKAMNTPVE